MATLIYVVTVLSLIMMTLRDALRKMRTLWQSSLTNVETSAPSQCWCWMQVGLCLHAHTNLQILINFSSGSRNSPSFQHVKPIKTPFEKVHNYCSLCVFRQTLDYQGYQILFSFLYSHLCKGMFYSYFILQIS